MKGLYFNINFIAMFINFNFNRAVNNSWLTELERGTAAQHYATGSSSRFLLICDCHMACIQASRSILVMLMWELITIYKMLLFCY